MTNFLNNGWVKLYRKIFNNDYLIRNPKAFIIFCYCLCCADKPTGKFTTGRKQIEIATGIGDTTAYKILKNLEKRKIINIKSNNKYSEIYICNWHKYQCESDNNFNNKVTTKRVLPCQDVEKVNAVN